MSSSIWSPGGNNTPAVDPLSQIKSQLFAATEGQTLFAITAFTYALNSGAITVFVNRAKVPNAEVTETSTTSFTLAPCEVGDIVEVVGNTAISDPGNAVALAEASAAAAVVSAAEALASRNTALAAEEAALEASVVAASYVPLNWRGAWVTATAYVVNDAFSYAGSSYVVRVAHISDTVAADLAAARLDVIAERGDDGSVLSVAGKTGDVTLVKADVGLGNVDNTSDAAKPISTATQLALDLKVSKDSNTGAATLPVGTALQRPAAPLKGMFRYNDDLDIFEGYTEGIGWGQVGGGQMYGTATVKAIFFNAQTINEDVTILAGQNGGSFGAISIANGKTVTLADGSSWTVV